MKNLSQYNQYLKFLYKIQDDFYMSSCKELTGKIVKYTDDYCDLYTEMNNDPDYEYPYHYINPNSRMRIIEIVRRGTVMNAQVEYINYDSIDSASFDDEVRLDYLVLVDDGE